ncbi:HD domain-containing phosphohydrolase [Megalodesulfovibrio gigas]|uniref:Putative response regulator receiver protein n=1 Tax=Megalodesulfovibrio gigas (strain ATCC 19364 / DSM 1382 / NCIMB 9332 / VKM B-1759) TaxID=1121448 RepID=T2GAD5_MEGG1|nr:HD domain-containing phosphohydrolase [Megalodesulfovibrio gigas]AGW13253.1 putative response regulator receiver protein [Megalodesulfovibrio gigas DSM 1382 = ATCC 19364]
MKHKILFVDDEVNILESFKVSLRKLYAVTVAAGPEEGLKQLRLEGPFAVVVSDLKMPGMDGIQFLSKVNELSPDSVRMMLTGYADLDAAIAAVNQGHIFRFLTKPCAQDVLQAALEAATHQYALVVAEKELLKGTVRGSIKILTDVLSLVKPVAFGRSERVKRLAVFLGERVQLKNLLQLELAAMLSQLGCVSLPDSLLEKVNAGEELTPEEREVYDRHPEVAATLLMNIPRMGRVAEIIRQQNGVFSEMPEMLLEARLLKISLDYDALVQQRLNKPQALERMRNMGGVYDPSLLDVLAGNEAQEEAYLRREVALAELAEGMVLDEALRAEDGAHIMPKGAELTETALARLHNFMRSKQLPESVLALVPRGMRR